MEAALIWLSDFLLWLCMRMVRVTVPLANIINNRGSIASRKKLELPSGVTDFSIAATHAKEFLDDQNQAGALIMDKFKTLIGMYTFSLPVMIGFLSPRLVLYPKLGLLILGVLVCIPGYCFYKFFSVKSYCSYTLEQSDLSQSIESQQIGLINWYLAKGDSISDANKFNVNIYFAAYRWLAISLIILLGMTLFTKRPAEKAVPSPVNNYFADNTVSSFGSDAQRSSSRFLKSSQTHRKARW